MSTVAGVEAHTPSSFSSFLTLTAEAVFRIEVSLSSRKSRVIVTKCTARLYLLEGGKKAESDADQGDCEWKSVAYGVPCIQITRETTKDDSPVNIKLVIAEVESGIALWECVLMGESKYCAIQTNFHSFSVDKKIHAVMFANDAEAGHFLEYVQNLLYQKENMVSGSSDRRNADDLFFNHPKLQGKLSKKDISTPCNFKHVSGITLQRTRVCEAELRGSIRRKMRFVSLSSRSGRRKKPQQSSTVMSVSSCRDEKNAAANKTNKSFKQRIGSFRVKKKQHIDLAVTQLSSSPPPNDDDEHFVRGSDSRRSLPSMSRTQHRPGLKANSFFLVHSGDEESSTLTKGLSLSSGDITSAGRRWSNNQLPRDHIYEATSTFKSTDTNNKSPKRTNPRSPVRHHSMLENSHNYNYTPYSKSIERDSWRNPATHDKKFDDDSQHLVTPDHTQHVIMQANLSPRMNYDAVAVGKETRSPQMRARLEHSLRNSNQNVMSLGEGQSSETLHGKWYEDNHNHNTEHHNLPSQPGQNMPESHTLNATERDFQRPIGSRATYMGMEYNQEMRKWEGRGGSRSNLKKMTDGGCGQQFTAKEVSAMNEQHLVCVDGLLPVLGEATCTSFGHTEDTNRQELAAKSVQPPQTLSEISSVPFSYQNQSCKPGYKSASSIAVGVESEPSSCHLQKGSVPDSWIPGTPEVCYKIPYSAPANDTTGGTKCNLMNRPMGTNNRPIAVTVPHVPLSYKPHPQHLQEPHPQQLQEPPPQECQLRTHPKELRPQHQHGIKPVRMERQSYNGIKRHSHSPSYPQGTNLANERLYKCQSQESPVHYGMEWKLLQTDLDSVPVPVQPPTMPMSEKVARRVTMHSSNASTSSVPVSTPPAPAKAARRATMHSSNASTSSVPVSTPPAPAKTARRATMHSSNANTSSVPVSTPPAPAKAARRATMHSSNASTYSVPVSTPPAPAKAARRATMHSSNASLSSVPVQTSTPPVSAKMGRRATMHSSNASMSSSTAHNFAPQSAQMTLGNPPQWENGSQDAPPLEEQQSEHHGPVNGLFGRTDWTKAELMAFTEQMSKVIEHFSKI